MRITILTIGSRGDVDPCLALALGLKQAGYDVTLGTGPTFETLITSRGIRFSPIRWDTYDILHTEEGQREIAGYRLSDLWYTPPTALARWPGVMEDVYQAARDADLMIYHPYVQGAYDVTEKLRIPAILWGYSPQFTPTGQFPSPYVPYPQLKLGRWINRLTHSAMCFILFKKLIGVRNRWRKERLGLPPRPWYASDFHRNGRPLPVLYAFSRHVIAPPPDWRGPFEVTGYWPYEDWPGWQPPADLVDFLQAGPPPVYVCFGSMVSADPARVSEIVLQALQQTGQRGILSAGWGGLSHRDGGDKVFYLGEAPYRWLFPQVAAVVHHGGAGTTAAALRAGKPTIICPYSFDQPFWGQVVWQLGVGPRPIPQAKLSVQRLADAIRTATSDEALRQRVALLGAKIRSEDGVARAVEVIRSYLSKSVVRSRRGENSAVRVRRVLMNSATE